MIKRQKQGGRNLPSSKPSFPLLPLKHRQWCFERLELAQLYFLFDMSGPSLEGNSCVSISSCSGRTSNSSLPCTAGYAMCCNDADLVFCSFWSALSCLTKPVTNPLVQPNQLSVSALRATLPWAARINELFCSCGLDWLKWCIFGSMRRQSA